MQILVISFEISWNHSWKWIMWLENIKSCEVRHCPWGGKGAEMCSLYNGGGGATCSFSRSRTESHIPSAVTVSSLCCLPTPTPSRGSHNWGLAWGGTGKSVLKQAPELGVSSEKKTNCTASCKWIKASKDYCQLLMLEGSILCDTMLGGPGECTGRLVCALVQNLIVHFCLILCFWNIIVWF